MVLLEGREEMGEEEKMRMRDNQRKRGGKGMVKGIDNDVGREEEKKEERGGREEEGGEEEEEEKKGEEKEGSERERSFVSYPRLSYGVFFSPFGHFCIS